MRGGAEPAVITIDGPAASGKSTIARGVAQALGHVYVDSGALYRGITWKALESGTSVDDADAVARLADALDPLFAVECGAVCFSIDGIRLDAELREERINAGVSQVAANPAVRKRIVAWLQDMVRFGPLVMEGRDIGTAVFPCARHKFYLDASAGERARRRHDDMTGAGVSIGEVHDSLERRDKIDTTRTMDPLQVAEGAVVIDSTNMAIEETVAAVLEKVQ